MPAIRKLEASEVTAIKQRSIAEMSTTIYAELARAFDYFNKELFSSQLPSCIITLHRKHNAKGYYWNSIYQHVNADVTTDEIALNPECFNRDAKDVLSTLVHEMVHLWQECFGTPSSKYHNKEWAAKMRAIGLQPTDTGMQGGKETGMYVTHLIVKDGAFDKAVIPFLETFKLEWMALPPEKKEVKKSTVKYVCPTCGMKATAKPDLNIVCGECEEQLEQEEVEE